MGQSTGGTGSLDLSGSTINLGGGTRTITVANSANTLPTISNGGLIVNAGAGALSIGANTYSGSTTINSGTVRLFQTGTFGDGTGMLNLNGGNVNVILDRGVSFNPITNPINMTANTLIDTTDSGTSGLVNVVFSTNNISGSAGTLTFRNNGATSSSNTFQPRFTGNRFDFNRPIVIDNGAIGKTKLISANTTGTSHTFSGVISGNGSYNRTANTALTGGTSVLTAANTFSGGTTITDGLLLVNNSTGSGTGSGSVTVGAGTSTAFHGTLGGTGSISGAITVQEGGTLAPGSSGIGTLTDTSNVTFAANSHFAIELSGAGADQLVVGENLNLAAAEFLDVTGSGAGPWLIATYGGTLTGSFNNVTTG